ncbi:MAG TPA: hypothetical protein VEX38_03375, partial [Fimbriimonadaceae bacterium]|nr:hypothetical protein [Fimbriimonadaceae bacterium]
EGVAPDGRRIVKLTLRDRRGDLALIVVERTQKVDDLERVEGNSNYRGGTINGLNCVTWSDQGAACMLIGDRPIEDLCALADGIR